MLCVGDGVTDDRLEEAFENTTGLFVDHGGDTLDTTTSGKTADGRLGDTLDIVSQDLAVSLRASFAKSFSTFSSARHISKWLGVLLLCGGWGVGGELIGEETRSGKGAGFLKWWVLLWATN